MDSVPVCPDVKQYVKLATGQLSSPDIESLLGHLQGCEACAQRVDSISERDTLVDLIRQAQTVPEGATGEAVVRLVERLRALRPEGKPAAKADAVRLTCSACGKVSKVKAELAGKKVKCPHCQKAIAVPNAAPATSSLAESCTLAPEAALSGKGTLSHTAGSGSNVANQNKELCAFLAPAQAADEIGRLGDYRILKVLGAGGMGVVFEAEDTRLQRIVALKAMLPNLATSPAAKERFIREARSAAKLKHDHIVTIHQVGEERGAPYLAMEFLEGEPLDDRLHREGRLPLPEVLRIGREIAEGLAAAHERGLIHRDIKPANIWLETRHSPLSPRGRGARGEGARVKILDFGLARAATSESHLTQDGAIVGTPAYMAPEQAKGKNVDPRCDLFSLGCILYRMATGEAPFKGSDMISTLVAVSTHDPAPPVALNLELPTELSDLTMSLLEKEPEKRPASAQVVVEQLERMSLDQQTPVKARPPEKTNSPAPQRGRRVAVAAVAAAALLIALGVWRSGILIRVESKDGTLIIKSHDPTAAVKITPEGGATLTYGKDRREIRLKPGKYGIELAEAKAGQSLSLTQFTIASGDNRTIEVIWEKKEPATASKTTGPPDGRVVPLHAVAPFDAVRARAHQEAWAKHLGVSVETTNSIGMKMVLIPPGKFLMGSPESDKDADASEKPQREVAMPLPFRMSMYEVTHEQFTKIMGRQPDQESTGLPDGVDLRNYAAGGLSWLDAVELCNKLSVMEGKKPPYDPAGNLIEHDGYRMPTEAEWEYACRAGTTAAYSFGDNKANIREFAWTHKPGLRRQPVGAKKPNPFGLYDMHGNVWEWCQDIDLANLESAPSAPKGSRIIRGGGVAAYSHLSNDCRSAYPGRVGKEWRAGFIGLRVIQSVSTAPEAAPVPDYANLVQGRSWIQVLPSEAEFKRLMEANALTSGEAIYQQGTLHLNGSKRRGESAQCVFPIDATNAIMRTKVKFVSGKVVWITLRRSESSPSAISAWLKPGASGITANRNGQSVDLCKGPQLRVDDFVELAIAAVGPAVSVYVDGRNVMEAIDANPQHGQFTVGASGAGSFRDIELLVLDQQPTPPDKMLQDLPLFTNSLGMEFALIPKGKSWLGGGGGQPGDREVEFTEDFYLGVYEVTQGEWEKVMGYNPSQASPEATDGKLKLTVSKRESKTVAASEIARCPVENVSWDECQQFLVRLNQECREVGWSYRLATEDEWEYACRGGPLKDRQDSRFHFHLDEPSDVLPIDQAHRLHQSAAMRSLHTWRVGSYQPNPLGLHDLHGNVAEWCHDTLTDDEGKSVRPRRGGSWRLSADFCVARHRSVHPSSFKDAALGLRVARVHVGPRAATLFKNTLGMEFALIPKGKSWLGGGADKPGDREVEFQEDFYLGVYEVTQEEWEKVMGNNPSAFSRTGPEAGVVAQIPDEELKRFPVESISWDEALLFVRKLNEQDRQAGWKYRLPTGDQWEYACRGGPLHDPREAAFSYYLSKPTSELTTREANLNKGLNRTVKVGSYAANPLGLYDMHGNVWEWSEDLAKPGPRGEVRRTDLGGGWRDSLGSCRASERGTRYPASRSFDIGLRLVRVRVRAVNQESAVPQPASEQFVPLFNGKDLKAWKAYYDPFNNRRLWQVSEGAIANDGKTAAALLFTGANYRDFHLRVTVRSPGGAAILFRHAGDYAYRSDVRSGSLLQLPGSFLGKLQLLKSPDARLEVKSDEWLVQEILAKGNEFTVLVNGQQVLTYADSARTPRAGAVGLYVHGGCQVWVQKMEIKAIP